MKSGVSVLLLKNNIVVIGGYGKVGQTICMDLAVAFPGKVYAAGRNIEKAKRFCESTGNCVLPLQVDATLMPSKKWLSDAALVISCLDEADASFAASCLENGCNFITISADRNLLADMEKLPSAEGCCVLGVGLAPGLTNLLAQYASSGLDEIESVDLSVLLGLGEKHGKAAIDWTMNSIASVYYVNTKSHPVQIRSFTGKRTVDLGEFGKRSTYLFPFPDQFSLIGSLGAKTVHTRLCFDSQIITRLVAAAAKVGITRLLHRRYIRSVLTKILSIPFGTNAYAIKAEAKGMVNGEFTDKWCMLSGKEEAQITAAVTTCVAKLMLRNPTPSGQHYIEDLFRISGTDHLPMIQLKHTLDEEVLPININWADSKNKKTTA